MNTKLSNIAIAIGGILIILLVVALVANIPCSLYISNPWLPIQGRCIKAFMEAKR